MTSSVDPQNQIAVWSYVSNGSLDDEPDKLLIYNYALGQWSIANVSAGLIAPFYTPGYTLEQLDNINASLDALPASLDSPLYKGGQYLFGGALGKKIFTFSGDPLTGLIETGETGLATGRQTIVTRAYPYHEGGSVTVQIGTRGLHSDDVTFTTAQSPSADGFAPFRAQGRYHRARMNISGNWSFAQGMDIDAAGRQAMTTRTSNFRILNPILATTREIAELLNRTINGGLNSWDYVTLSSNATETTHEDPRFSKRASCSSRPSITRRRTFTLTLNRPQLMGR